MVDGGTTNKAFLLELLDRPEVQSGQLDTAWLDRLTARTIVSLLRAAWADADVGGPFVAALAVAGRSGTLADRMRTPPARGNVFAKTGTTDIASALSGFVRRRFLFSVLQNGRPLSISAARRAQDGFASVLAAQ